MRDLTFTFEVQEIHCSVFETQCLQLWPDEKTKTMVLTVYVRDDVGGKIEGNYVRIDNALHVGYKQTCSKEYSTGGLRHLMLRYEISGFQTKRNYQVLLEPEIVEV